MLSVTIELGLAIMQEMILSSSLKMCIGLSTTTSLQVRINMMFLEITIHFHNRN